MGRVRPRRSAALRITAAIALTVTVAGCDVILQGPGGAAGRAERRVRIVLENLVSHQGRGGREADVTTAMAAWWDGSTVLSGDPAIEARVDDEFRAWRDRKGLVYGGLGSFEVIEATAPAAGDGPVVVAVTIDGRSYKLAVEPGRPLRWAE